MIYTESAFTAGAASLLVAVMVLSACASGSSVAQDPVASETAEVETPVVEEPTTVPTEAPAETPTEVPTPEPEPLSDTEMIALARTTFDADPQPGELIAWDHLDATAFGDRVRLEICSWTGDTVFDDLRTIEYEIRADGTANYLFDGSIPGDCLNTELIDSALAFTRDYDTYWASVLEEPTTFDPEVERQFSTDSGLEVSESLANGWINDGVHWESHSFDGDLPGSSIQPIAWRNYERDPLNLLELISCREMRSTFGLYRGNVLIDDERDANAIGQNVIHNYQLARSGETWLVAGVDILVWADCFAGDWLPALDAWKSEPTGWSLLG